MIRPEELRVGNWVNLEFVGPFQWDWKDFAEYVKDKRDGYDLTHLNTDAVISDKIDPIPLSPEILEGCGFVKDKNDSFRFLNYPFEYNVYNAILIFKTSVIEYHIEYLHKLQNLYFALTGKELPVKLPVTA